MMAASGSADARRTPAVTGHWRRIAVVLESGRSGQAALDRAVALAREHEAELSVVALAPQAERSHCAGPSPQDLNAALWDATAADLKAARTRIHRSGDPGCAWTLLVEGQDPPLAQWVRQHEIDLVLLPARRSLIRRRRHPQARHLRAHVQVRVVVP
jgi:hypothetical protein